MKGSMKAIYKKAALCRARLIKKHAKKNPYTSKSYVTLRVYDKDKKIPVYRRFNYVDSAIARHKTRESFIYIDDMKLGLSYRKLAIDIAKCKSIRAKRMHLEYYTVPKPND